MQENVEAVPEETVTDVTEIVVTDIAKEQKVETEIQESTELPIAPG